VVALNDILPASVRVNSVEVVDDSFHARHSAKAKTYRYRIYRKAVCPPFLANYVYHDPYPMNEEAVMRSSEHAVGIHDFTSFAASDPERSSRVAEAARQTGNPPSKENSNVRTIHSSQWTRTDEELVYTVRGNGFLHHMVRNLVGTFLQAGKGSLQPDDVATILEARNRSAAGPTAAACGLYLLSVEY
jgi:tRNA pseudouridine38-40 synthase